MRLLESLRLRFRPPRLEDPEFGTLTFMYIPRAPARSYWECEWLFPPTSTRVSVVLPGTSAGPTPEARAFYRGLPARFDDVVRHARPGLDRVFRDWIGRPLQADLWQDVTLAGFGVEDPAASPIRWDVSFETIGETWLGITMPFIGDAPQDPVVDT